jgi:general L-amino acid transport system substrate-binding protein
MKWINRVALVVAAGGLFAASAHAGTLDDVKKEGMLKCGVSQGLPGFSNPDNKGNWTGIDVDYCRALAAAVLGDAKKVKYVPLSAKVRFTALQSGEIDVLSRNTTWTFTRDTNLGINFVGVLYYDGQGFMVPKKLGVKSALKLSGAAVCTNTGTTTELNLADYFRSHNMKYKVVAFENSNEVFAAYEAGRCDVYTTDRSGLAAQRTKLKNPNAHIVLPEIISKEPLGPAVRQGDDQWANIARWTLNTMIIAEELGVSSKNVDQMKKSKNPEVRRLLGVDGKYGSYIGLDNAWAYRIIKQVGNYAEIFKRNVTPIGLDRGLNRLWNKGGILYAPPFR